MIIIKFLFSTDAADSDDGFSTDEYSVDVLDEIAGFERDAVQNVSPPPQQKAVTTSAQDASSNQNNHVLTASYVNNLINESISAETTPSVSHPSVNPIANVHECAGCVRLSHVMISMVEAIGLMSENLNGLQECIISTRSHEYNV